MDTDDVTSGNPWGLEPLLDVNDLAACLRVPVATVYDWRTNGKGPRAYRFGKHLKVRDLGRARVDGAATRTRTTCSAAAVTR